MDPVRTFLAIPLPDNIKEYLVNYSKPIMDRNDRINWVKKDNIHITIGFLGDTRPDVIDEQAEGLGKILADYPAINMGLTDTGIFPHANSPRVLWIGAMPYDKTLIVMVDVVKDHLRSLGYELDNRKFQPHITLGRVKSISRKSVFIHDFLSSEVRDMSFPVAEIKWFESELTSTGAIYKELKTFKLKVGGQE